MIRAPNHLLSEIGGRLRRLLVVRLVKWRSLQPVRIGHQRATGASRLTFVRWGPRCVAEVAGDFRMWLVAFLEALRNLVRRQFGLGYWRWGVRNPTEEVVLKSWR